MVTSFATVVFCFLVRAHWRFFVWCRYCRSPTNVFKQFWHSYIIKCSLMCSLRSTRVINCLLQMSHLYPTHSNTCSIFSDTCSAFDGISSTLSLGWCGDSSVIFFVGFTFVGSAHERRRLFTVIENILSLKCASQMTSSFFSEFVSTFTASHHSFRL